MGTYTRRGLSLGGKISGISTQIAGKPFPEVERAPGKWREVCLESFPPENLGHLSFPIKVLWGQDRWLAGPGVGTDPLALTGLALSLRTLWRRAAAALGREVGALTREAGGWHQVGHCICAGLGARPARAAPLPRTSPCASLPAAPLPAAAAVAAAAAAAKTEVERRARKHFSFFFFFPLFLNQARMSLQQPCWCKINK